MQGENPEVKQARRMMLVNVGIIPTLVKVCRIWKGKPTLKA